MIAVEMEINLWKDLLEGVSSLLNDICDKRAKVQDNWDEPTPSFNRAEWLVSDVYDFIEGRLQELDPVYSERTVYGKKAQARKALSYGINYQALKGLSYEETERVLKYIEEQGLESMDYEVTRKALKEYWGSELDAQISRAIGVRGGN